MFEVGVHVVGEGPLQDDQVSLAVGKVKLAIDLSELCIDIEGFEVYEFLFECFSSAMSLKPAAEPFAYPLTAILKIGVKKN